MHQISLGGLLITENIKMTYTHRLKFNKSNQFLNFIKDIVKSNWLFAFVSFLFVLFFHTCMVVKDTIILAQFVVTALIRGKDPAVLPTIAFSLSV